MAFKINNPLHLHGGSHSEDPTTPKQTKKENTKQILGSTPIGGNIETSDRIVNSFQKGITNANQMDRAMNLATKLQRAKDSIRITNSLKLFKRGPKGMVKSI